MFKHRTVMIPVLMALGLFVSCSASSNKENLQAGKEAQVAKKLSVLVVRGGHSYDTPQLRHATV